MEDGRRRKIDRPECFRFASCTASLPAPLRFLHRRFPPARPLTALSDGFLPQPSHLPVPSTGAPGTPRGDSGGVSPPAPAPSPGTQRTRSADGQGWVSACSASSCPTEAWVTALYPAAQAAALRPAAADWPEVWGCAGAAGCRFNGQCVAGRCEVGRRWGEPLGRAVGERRWREPLERAGGVVWDGARCQQVRSAIGGLLY